MEKQIILKRVELENTASDALAGLLKEVTDQLTPDTLKKFGLEDAGEIREQALTIYQQSRETGGWIKHFLRSIWLNKKESCWTLLWPAVALAVIFAAGAAAEHFLASSPPFQALVADLKALGGTTLAALLLISKNVTAFNARLAPLRERFQDWERKRKDALEAAEQKAVTVRAKLADLVAERDNTRLARDEAIRRRVHLESLKKGERPEELLSHYISARADSQDYRRHLGLVSLMSRDFQRMSRLLTDAASRKDATPKRRTAPMAIRPSTFQASTGSSSTSTTWTVAHPKRSFKFLRRFTFCWRIRCSWWSSASMPDGRRTRSTGTIRISSARQITASQSGTISRRSFRSPIT